MLLQLGLLTLAGLASAGCGDGWLSASLVERLRLREVWSTALFLLVLVLDYAVWFHAWPLWVKRYNGRSPEQPISEERTASLALRGFTLGLALFATLGVVLWLLGTARR